jgi:(p)ppGpp synthase/HD superfamily hydrolase
MDILLAERVARDAHAGIDDRQGIPVIEHVRRVAHSAPEWAQVVAWLHDTVEDTDMTFDDLRAMGLSQLHVEALKLVTRDKADGLTYMQWIRKIAAAPGEAGRIARAVKWADLQDNYSRPASCAADEEMKEKRYARAIRILGAAMRERDEL